MIAKPEFVYILPNSAGGVASVVSNLIRYSSNIDICKKVILIGKYRNELPCSVDFGNAEIILEYKKKWLDNKFLFMKRIARHISDHSIIICNDGYPEFSMIEAFQISNPIISILHGDNNHYFNGCIRYGYLIDKIICVSSFLKSKAEKYLPNNTNPDFIPVPVPCTKKPRKRNEKITISYAGDISHMKGCDYFIQLIEGLEQNAIDYEFEIFGDGELFDEIKNKIKFNANVHLYGRQSNDVVLSALASSDIFILFSKSEGLPVCVVEAMKNGCVPVVFDLPTGIPDLIDDNINGYRLPQNDIAGVIERINRLSLDKELLTNMSNAAIKKSMTMFDPFIQASKYESDFLNTKSRKNKFDVSRLKLKHRIMDMLPFALTNILNKWRNGVNLMN